MTVTTISGTRVFGHADASTWDVVVRDGLIERVERAGEITSEGAVVDGRGHTLVPGLIDTHVHLTGRRVLEAAVRAGVTTVVDLGTHPDSLVDALRDEARQGGISDVISAGSAASAPGSTQISVMGFPAESAVTDPADAERYLSWRGEVGSDLIKLIVEDPDATAVPALAPETLTALVAGAHRRGLLAVAHVVTAAAFSRGLDADAVFKISLARRSAALSRRSRLSSSDSAVVVPGVRPSLKRPGFSGGWVLRRLDLLGLHRERSSAVHTRRATCC